MADIETLPANTRYFTEVAAPSTPSTGQGVLYAATDGTLHYLNDAASDIALGAGGGMTNPMTTAGDIIYSSDGSGTPARLAAGTDGHVMTLASGVPSWAAAAGGIDSGSSFPVSPSTNDLYFHTSHQMLFFYDGTRWLTTTQYLLQMPADLARSANGGGAATICLNQLTTPALDMYIEQFFVSYLVETNSGSAYWTYKVNYKTSPNSDNDLSGASISTAAASALTYTHGQATVNAALPSGAFIVNLVSTKTGSPGPTYTFPGMTYRIIGT